MSLNNDPINEVLSATIAWAKRRKVLEFKMESKEFTEGRTGYSSEDISGFYLPESIQEYFMSNCISYMESVSEFGWFSSLKLLSLELPWQQWVWTLNSTQYVANDIVDEKIINTRGKKDKKNSYEELLREVSQEQIEEYLNKNYQRKGKNIWVNPKDFSDFQYDYKAKPYKLTDGWSHSQVEEIMKEWLKEVMQIEMPVKIK